MFWSSLFCEAALALLQWAVLSGVDSPAEAVVPPPTAAPAAVAQAPLLPPYGDVAGCSTPAACTVPGNCPTGFCPPPMPYGGTQACLPAPMLPPSCPLSTHSSGSGYAVRLKFDEADGDCASLSNKVYLLCLAKQGKEKVGFVRTDKCLVKVSVCDTADKSCRATVEVFACDKTAESLCSATQTVKFGKVTGVSLARKDAEPCTADVCVSRVYDRPVAPTVSPKPTGAMASVPQACPVPTMPEPIALPMPVGPAPALPPVQAIYARPMQTPPPVMPNPVSGFVVNERNYDVVMPVSSVATMTPTAPPVSRKVAVIRAYREEGKTSLKMECEEMTTVFTQMKIKCGPAGSLSVEACEQGARVTGKDWQAVAKSVEMADSGKVVLTGNVVFVDGATQLKCATRVTLTCDGDKVVGVNCETPKR